MTGSFAGGQRETGQTAALHVGLVVAARIANEWATLRACVSVVNGTEAAELAAAFRRTGSAEWRDSVPVRELLTVYERSRAWCAIDAAARASLDRIRAQVFARYGVDVRDPRADPASGAGALAVRAGIERETTVLDLAEAAQAMAHAGAGAGGAGDGNAAAQLQRGERALPVRR